MYLCQTSNSDRFDVERTKEPRHGFTSFFQEQGFEFFQGSRETLILEGFHRECPRGGNELNRREMLTELKRRIEVNLVTR